MSLVSMESRQKFSFWSNRGIPGPTPIPIFGNSLPMMFHSIGKIDQQHIHKYGKMYGTYEGSVPVLCLHDPALLHHVYNTNFPDFANQFSMNGHAIESFRATHIIFSSGEYWKNLRYTMTRAMANNSLKHSTDRIDNRDLIKDIRFKEGLVIGLADLLKKYSINMVANVMFGLDFDLYNNPSSEKIIRATRNVTIALSPFIFLPYSKFWLASRIPLSMSKLIGLIPETTDAVRYYKDMIEDALEKHMGDDESLKRSDIIHSFVHSMRTGILTEEEVIVNSIMLISTLSNTMHETLCFMLYALAQNPEVQANVHREIDDLPDDASYEDLSQLKYLDAVFMETMRCYPPEARGHRVVTAENGTRIPGTNIHLPKDTIINISILALHFDPQYWKDPLIFNPDRFLPGCKEQLMDCTFMTFASGPRKCPGIVFGQIMVKKGIVPILREFSVINPQPEVFEYPKNARKFTPAILSVRFVKRNMMQSNQ